MPRYLDDSEKALWQKVVETIKPLSPTKTISSTSSQKPIMSSKRNKMGAKLNTPETSTPKPSTMPTRADLEAALRKPIATPSKPSYSSHRPSTNNIYNKHAGLDGHWEKRFNKGTIIPDISIDLHGAGLQTAYNNLDSALEQARAQKLRVILLITGRPRQYDRTSGEGRGGIRAVISDWLSASRHSDSIASVRSAHPRHGGAGALYIILRK